MEASQSRVARSQHDPQARPSVLQMHRLHGHIRNVQAVRESRLLGSQHRREERQQEQELHFDSRLVQLNQFSSKASANQR